MSWHLSHLIIRVLVFGLALGFAAHTDKDVKVQPRWFLPLVAGAFAIMNTLLYTLIATAFNVVTLFTLWFAVPFAANGVLLLATDRLIKQFKIESLTALIKSAGIVTAAHIILHFVNV